MKPRCWHPARLIRERLPRSLITVAVAAGHITLGVLYLVPAWVRRQDIPPSKVSVVAFIDSFGPTWTALFWFSGLALAAAMVARRGLAVAHVAAAALWAGYTVALWVGAIASAGPYLTPVVALVLVACQAATAMSYGDDEAGSA